jgi:hypothetical protein
MDTPTQQHPKESLRVIAAPNTSHFVSAPPILVASAHTVDYACGYCGTVLMHAEREQVYNLEIHCMRCGRYNSTAS